MRVMLRRVQHPCCYCYY